MLNLFSPHGSNPLGNVRLSNPRNAKVDFDRSVKSNVLTMEGDLTQSKMQIPREDRPVASLQLIHPLLCVQLMIPSSGQFLVELAVSHSSVVRMKMTCGTHISKPDVNEVKGVAHVKLPLAIPRNSWTQVVFHVPGIFTHLFGLPSVRWVDTVTIAGSVKLKRILVTSEEQLALESRPLGMLLYTLPAYGPPLWTGKCGVAQPDSNAETTSTPQVESVATEAPRTPVKTAPALQKDNGASRTSKTSTPPDQQGAEGGGFKLRFVRGENGEVGFSASSEQQQEERRLQKELEEAAAFKKQQQEAHERQTRAREEEMMKIQEDRRGYIRLMESPAPNVPTSRFGLPLRKKVEGVPGPTESSANDELPTGWNSDDESPFNAVSNIANRGQMMENKEKKGPTVWRNGPLADTRKPRTAKANALPGSGPTPTVTAGGPLSPTKTPGKIKHASLVQLNLAEPGATHPSDSYLPAKVEKQPVGYGVGCLEVISSADSPTSSPPPAGNVGSSSGYGTRRIERIPVNHYAGGDDDEEEEE